MKPSLAATARATANVPSANRGHSKTPIGPFQNTVFAPAITSLNSSPRSRADVESEPALGQFVVAHDPKRRLGGERLGGHDVARQQHIELEGSGGAPTSSAILPPISTRSAREPEIAQHRDLVGDLGTAGDEHERALEDRRAAARDARALASRSSPA